MQKKNIAALTANKKVTSISPVVSGNLSGEYLSATASAIAVAGHTVPFSEFIRFDQRQGYSVCFVDKNDILFKVDPTNRMPGASHLLYIIANGINNISFSSEFTQIENNIGAPGIDNREGIANWVHFFYTGTHYCYRVMVNVVNTELPMETFLTDCYVGRDDKNKIVLTFSNYIYEGTVPPSISVDSGKSIVDILYGNKTIWVNMSSDFEPGERPLLSYFGGLPQILDINELPVMPFQHILAKSYSNLDWDYPSSVVDFVEEGFLKVSGSSVDMDYAITSQAFSDGDCLAVRTKNKTLSFADTAVMLGFTTAPDRLSVTTSPGFYFFINNQSLYYSNYLLEDLDDTGINLTGIDVSFFRVRIENGHFLLEASPDRLHWWEATRLNGSTSIDYRGVVGILEPGGQLLDIWKNQ